MDAHAAGKTYDCKQPGCTNEARSPVGRYSYCDAHQGQGARKGAPGRLTAVSGSTEQRIKSLAAQARTVDRARAKARKLTEQALAAKNAADAAERAFQEQMREVLGEEGNGVRVAA